VDGTLVLQGSDHDSQVEDWQVVDLLGSPASAVTTSFEQLFKLYRGPRFTDELESLGSSAAKEVNRLRSRMPRAPCHLRCDGLCACSADRPRRERHVSSSLA
jgi:hypothetical protein